MVCFSIRPGQAVVPVDLTAFVDLCAVLSQGLLELVHKHLPGAEIDMEVAEGASLVRVASEVFRRAEAMRSSPSRASDPSRQVPVACPPAPAGECAGQPAEAPGTHRAGLSR
jgi:hypothetical protein